MGRVRRRAWGPLLAALFLLAALSLVACGDPMDAVSGSESLTGTGCFADIVAPSRLLVGAQSWSCDVMQLVVSEWCRDDCYQRNDYVAMQIHLPPPFFLGRTYGRGTKLSLQHRGGFGAVSAIVTRGGITVQGVTAYTEPGQGDEVTLAFDLGAVEVLGTGALESLSGEDGTLRGLAAFRYGGTGDDIRVTGDDSVIRTDCLAPQFSSGGEIEGGHLVPSGPSFADAVPAGPPAWWGTEVNRIEVEDRGVEYDLNGHPQIESEIVVRVTPPAAGGGLAQGNGFCEEVVALNAPLACPPGALEPFTVTQLPVTFVDRFGLRPTLVGDAETWGYGAVPTITAPAGDTVVYAGEPLAVAWDPSDAAGAALQIVVGFDAAPDVAPYEVTVEETGSATLDVPWPADYAGAATVTLRRTWEPADPFPWPVAPGSSVRVVRERSVSVEVGAGALLELLDPSLVAEGWTAPEPLGASSPGAADRPPGLLRRGPDGQLWAAWIDPTTGRAALRARDPASGAWGADVAPGGSAAVQQGPLGLVAADGLTLLSGYRWDAADRLYVPTVRSLYADGTAGCGVLTGAAPHSRGFGFAATVLGDGAPFVAFSDDERDLWLGGCDASLGLAVADANAGQASLAAYARADGGVTVTFSATGLWKAWYSNPGDPLLGAVRGLSAWLSSHGCAPQGAPDPDGRHAHFVCAPDYLNEEEVGLQYHRQPLSGGGDPAEIEWSEPVDLPFSAFLHASGVAREVAVAPDGALWFAQTVTCEWGVCVVLARRTADGAWEGPWLPRHVTAPPALALDAEGRPHLLYTDDSAGTPTATLVHTYLEVAP